MNLVNNTSPINIGIFSPSAPASVNAYSRFQISGINLGKHECYDDLGTMRKPYEILLEQLDGTNIPILAEVDICHTHPMHPIAIGKKVRLDATAQKIYCIEKWL
ncbi:hypothetical protein [Lysinibacillus sp. NPDC047702]|uniref:hypothetical protein n=1 Tax=unclassified Lysinibacillus TaxID=2636778 RepID=UPI003D070512